MLYEVITFALASAKSWHLPDMGTFATLLSTTLNVEMDIHRKTCAAFGIPAQELEKTRKSMITSAYTNLMVRTCHEGSLLDILAVLTPCACGYVEIGQNVITSYSIHYTKLYDKLPGGIGLDPVPVERIVREAPGFQHLADLDVPVV